MIAQFRERYRDIVHLLYLLEIVLPRTKVRNEYIDRSGKGRRGGRS